MEKDRTNEKQTFSQKLKDELVRQIDSSRHCQIAEISALFHFLNREIDGNPNSELVFRSENEAIIRKCFTLLRKTFNMYNDFVWETAPLREHGQSLELIVPDSERTVSFLEAAGSPTLTQKSCCKRAFLRGAFLAVGSVTDPEKSYHLEFVCPREEDASYLMALLSGFDIEAKSFSRKNSYIVYIKDGMQIAETLNVLGAQILYMEYENMRILKDVRNSVNRRVNCDTANVNKTVFAAQKVIDEINFLMKTEDYEQLPEEIRAIAELRIENPAATLTELGELCNPPLGKSGVNHRLRKISEIAEKVKGGEL